MSRHANMHLASNLRFLASHHRSITEACRELGINRQQFNKYLSGSVVPSAGIVRRVSEYYGIEDQDLGLAPDAFRVLYRAGVVSIESSLRREILRQLERQQALSSNLINDYVGYYFRYFPSFSRPGLFLRSLMHIGVRDGIGVFRCIERLPPERGRQRAWEVFKYTGVAFFLRERIFLLSRETLGGHELSETILFPSYSSGATWLHGIIAGCSALPTRSPVASRIVLERLGRTVNLRAAIGACNVLEATSCSLPQVVSDALRKTEEPNHLILPRQNLPST